MGTATAETTYILGGTLALLVADRRVTGLTLASREGQAHMGILVKAGSIEGISAFDGDTSLDLFFGPQQLTLTWTGEDGVLQEAVFRADDPANDLDDLLIAPLGLPRLAQRLGLAIACVTRPSTSANMPSFQRDTILMLLRHIAVGDVLFGCDGREATLQFQIRGGFAGVCEDPPQDWVGIEFTETGMDVSWFDWSGNFHMSSLETHSDAEAIAALCADPLGHVLKAGVDGRIRQAGQDLAGLMDRLRDSFSDARPVD